MTGLDRHHLGGGAIRTPHTVEFLPRVVRHATGRNAEGKSVFLSTDDDDRGRRELVNKSAIAAVNYSTYQHPVELKGDVDMEHAHENEPMIPMGNGAACRMVDFAPGGASPMQRVNNLDCAVVIEGVLKMILDSGEERIMKRGDIAVQQSTAHRWVNVTGNGLLPARILVVLFNTDDPHAGGEKVQRKLGRPRRDSVWLPSHQTEDEPDHASAPESVRSHLDQTEPLIYYIDHGDAE
ncbi:MAG: hypothetical protein Q9169_003307 [Polycauliona sp. 2 TL-2023]